MGLFSKFESKAEDVIEGSGGGRGGIEPVKLAKRAAKEMERGKMTGVGHEYAPTLYNILVSPEDDERMSGYYPSLAGEVETYLQSRAEQSGLTLDCPPLVRFITDDALKHGRFDIIAESVSPAIIEELRHEEMVRYGIEKEPAPPAGQPAPGQPGFDPFAPSTTPPGEAYGYAALDASPQAGAASQAAPAPQAAAAPQMTPAAAVGQMPVQGAPAAPPAGAAPQAAPGPQAAPVPQAGAPGQPGYPGPMQPQVPIQVPPGAPPQPGLGAWYGGVDEQNAISGTSEGGAAGYGGAAGAGGAAGEDAANRTVILGAAQQTPQATLVNRATGASWTITGMQVSIGREDTCQIAVGDASISRHHADILWRGTGWTVRDAGSTNGTKVNGTPVSEAPLRNGDVIELGKTALEFVEG